ncbi:hypothetical protein RIF29_14412 [Crotalaria pallida]|uniref:C2H2-type domain-containing protein n=1 Tax=Crotalaria pallida TaxID=3830 RepID=A0AAN9FK13_CROPI
MSNNTSRVAAKTRPAELAILRELAFRRKVAALPMVPNSDSTKEILPLEVKPLCEVPHSLPLPGPSLRSSSSLALRGTKWKESISSAHHPPSKISQVKPSCEVPHPMSLPGPISKPSSSQSLSGTKRKEPTSSAHHPPLQYQQSYHGSFEDKDKTKNLYCKICQAPCSSPSNLEQHLIGQKHAKKLQELEFNEKAGKKGGSNQRQWCELCKVSCSSEDLLKLHFNGQKHKAKLLKLEISKQGGEVPNSKKWCELCKLLCVDDFSFKQHLEGKKHIIKMHAFMKEKETWP